MIFRKISLDTSRAVFKYLPHDSRIFFLPVYVDLTTRIRLVVFICLEIGCITLEDDTVSLSGAREMEGDTRGQHES